MKKLVLLTLLAGFTLASCDTVDNAYIPDTVTDINTSYYSGTWSDYVANEWPTFTANTNTDRNVLIEDYTGHQCPNCPSAAELAETIHDANPDRVFIASVHAGPSPTGITAFQETNTTFTRDFTNAATIAYGGFFYPDYGFYANPMGTINRFPFGPSNDGSEMLQLTSAWANETTTMLNANDLKIDLQALSNFYDDTQGGYIHTEVEVKEDLNGTYKIVSYIIQNEIIDKQNEEGSIVPDYSHKEVLIGTLDAQPWGQTIAIGALTAGQTFNFDYSYGIPSGLTKDDVHFLIYVYDDATKEILQVIKHEF
jgi:hypothetical protein